jgi:hypothetical protein
MQNRWQKSPGNPPLSSLVVGAEKVERATKKEGAFS